MYDEGSSSAEQVTLGLVGLHITHKTKTQPNWIWSTFEQVDNLTSSFYNPACAQTPPYTANAPVPCKDTCCPPNTQTAAQPYQELDANGKPINRPVQVTRVASFDDDSAGELNGIFQKLLAGSVWANYKLVSTQWIGEAGTLPKPAYLGNTTMETFNQGPLPPTDGAHAYPSADYDPFSTAVSASCMKCHSKALLAGNRSVAGDFSFLGGTAQ